jgi:MFS family permease
MMVGMRTTTENDSGRPPRLVTLPFVIVTFTAFAFFVYIGMLIPIIPLFIEGPLDAGELGIGLNIAAFAVAAIIARPMIGRLADRYGRRSVIIAGAVLAAFAGASVGQVDVFWTMLPLRMLTGIGEAAVFVGAATLITDLSPRERRAEGASYFSVAVFSGLGIGPILGEHVLDDTQFERAFLVAGAFALIASAIAVFAPNSSSVADDASTNEIEPIERSGWRAFVHPAALLPGIVLAAGIGGLTTFFSFAPEYARTVGLANSGGLFLVYSLVSLVIRIFGAKLPERLGARRAVTMALLSMLAGLLVLGAVRSVASLWIGAALIGLGAAFNYPSLLALTVNRVSDSERASAVSSFTMFFEVGSAVGGLTIGAFAQIVGKQIGFFGGAASCLLGLWLLRVYVVPVGHPDGDPTSSNSPDRANFDAVESPRYIPSAGN